MVQVQVELVPRSLSSKGGMKKTVQTTPGMALVEILITACSEMQVDPGLHVLRHKKKEIDLTLPFRLAGLSNNATLELFELDADVASKRLVSVALQCEGGKRANMDASCTSTLLDLLAKFEDRLSERLCTGCAEKGLTPCVSFMNRNFEGEEALKGVSLLQLGVVTGSALLRHSFKRGGGKAEPQQAAQPHMEAEAAQEAPAAESKQEAMDAEPSQQQPEAMEVEGAAAAAASGERAWMVGKPREDGVADPSIMEVDDDLFEVTTQDLQVLEELRAKREKDANMFKTRKIREMEREARLSRFSECGVRVVFPDQTWIQARFSVQETLADVYSFVRGALAQDRPFYLYTTPPPTKLTDSKDDLIKYTQLLPSARIYFSFSQPPAGEPPFMAFKYIQRMEECEAEREREEAARKSRAEAAAAAQKQKQAAAEQRSVSFAAGEDAQGEGEATAAGGSSQGGQGKTALEAAEERAAKAQSRGAKQPKWFKMK